MKVCDCLYLVWAAKSDCSTCRGTGPTTKIPARIDANNGAKSHLAIGGSTNMESDQPCRSTSRQSELRLNVYFLLSKDNLILLLLMFAFVY